MSAGPSLNPTSAHHLNASPPTSSSPSNDLARNFEHPSGPTSTIGTQGLSHTEALIRKAAHLAAIQALATQFGGKTVDVSSGSVIVEMTGKSARVDAFLGLVKPYGILESVRSGESLSSSLARCLAGGVWFGCRARKVAGVIQHDVKTRLLLASTDSLSSFDCSSPQVRW